MTLLRIVIKCNILIKVKGNTPSTSLAIIRDNSLVIIVAKWIIVYSIISLFIFLNEIFINSFFYFGSTYLQQPNSTSLVFIIPINLMSYNDSKRVIMFLSRFSELEFLFFLFLFLLPTSSERRFSHAKIESRKLCPLWRAVTWKWKGSVVGNDEKSIKLRWDFQPGAFISREKSDFLK